MSYIAVNYVREEKKKGSSLFRVGNLKISILNSLLTALQ
jgi:hypothetical protein